MNPEELEDEWLRSEEDQLPRGLTLDTIEISGRPDESGDDALDVAESIERKGAPARARMERLPESTRMLQDAVELGEDVTEAAGLGRMADIPRRARAIPVVGGAIADWTESGTSGATGAVEGASLGFSDEIGAAGRGLVDAAGGADYTDAYEEHLEELRALQQRDRESSPVAYGLGEAAGALATGAALPGSGVSRTAGLGARLGGAALEGAGYGALAGVGHGNSETPEDMLGDLAVGGGTGAVGGLVGGAIGEGVQAGGRALSRAAERADELRVTSVVGSGNSPLSVRALRDVAALPGGTAGAAERIRRMGIGSAAGTVEDAAREASRAVDDTDAALGGFYGELDAALPDGIPADRFARGFEDVADSLSANPETARLAGRHAGRAGAWRDAVAGGERMTGVGPGARTPPGMISSRGAREALGAMREGVDFIGANEGRTAAGAELDAYRTGRRVLDDVAEEVLPAERAAEFRPMRADAATARTLERYARQAAMRADRAGPSLTAGLAANAAAAMGGGPMATMATGIGTGALRRRLPAMRATGAETVRSLLESGGARALGEYGPMLASALRRGGEVFAGTHAALMRAEPEYAAAVEAATPAEPPRTLADYLEEARAGAPAAESPTVDRRSFAELLREARGE